MGIVEWLMGYNFIYSQSWEDADADIQLYQLDDKSRVLMITTGGDNVLNYLAHGVEHVTSVDMNVYQNHLLELKRAVVITQSRENAMEILGNSNYDLLIKEWGTIQARMSPEAAKWWNGNTGKFRNFWRSGIVGIFAYIMVFLVKIFGITCLTREDERTEDRMGAFWFNLDKITVLDKVHRMTIGALAPFMGVPSRQLALNPKFLDGGIRTVIERLTLTQDFSKNYFFRPYLGWGWTDDCCPLYLRRGSYERLQKRLIKDPNLIDIQEGVIQRVTLSSPHKFNRVVLLDHMDWMDDVDILKEWAHYPAVTTSDCLFCFRSFCDTQPFACLRHLDFVVSTNIYDVNNKPVHLVGDRLGTYNSVHVAKRPLDLSLVSVPKFEMSNGDGAWTFYNMLVQPFKCMGMNNAHFMNAYYKTQSLNYDAYRQNLLHGKLPLMYSIPWSRYAGKKILLLAGGTGDLAEYFSQWIPSMDRIVISDISQPMIDKADARIKKQGWDNVHTRIEDVMAPNSAETDFGEYDLVICTYSITMMPNWTKAITRAKEYLKTGGTFAVADFTLDERQSGVSRWFWKQLFGLSHVNLNGNHLKMLAQIFEVEYLRMEYGTFPYCPGLTCPYYYGLFKKTE
jgi:S-adenosylmethionine:diacylglycerol 3-amino-3-carboxypropyl transferase/ubiquinone/menaquinone biosynthesis C-methylase UbiE